MKISGWKRLTKSDHPDLPEWAEDIVDVLNDHIERMTSALSGNLTPADNMLAEVRALEVRHDAIVSVELQRLKRAPVGVLLLQSSFFETARLAWRMSETRALTVDVKVRYDSVPEAVPTLTLLFLG